MSATDEQRKAELAGWIVSNTDEYDRTRAVRRDYPTLEALRTKRAVVKSDTVSANAADYPDPTLDRDAPTNTTTQTTNTDESHSAYPDPTL